LTGRVKRVNRWMTASASGLLPTSLSAMVGAGVGATRRDHGVDAGSGREIGRQRRTAPAHRFEIGHGRDRQPVLQPHQDLRAIILRPFDQPSLVEGGCLGRKHELAGRGKLALVGQFDLNDACALSLQDRNRLIENPRDFGIEIVDIERGGHADGEAFDRALPTAL